MGDALLVVSSWEARGGKWGVGLHESTSTAVKLWMKKLKGTKIFHESTSTAVKL